MNIALVHDWLTGMRGGEKCLEGFCELFPKADLYTLVYVPERVSETIRSRTVYPSWLNRVYGIERYYRYFLPLFPRIAEGFDLQGYDVILSSSHCVAKGINARGTLHIAYIHSPMRYVWDMHDLYFGPDSPWLPRIGMALCRKYLQEWDIRSSRQVNYFVANSRNVAAKVRKIYSREATVIYPPVELDTFEPRSSQEAYYLIVSALVPYKKIDVAVEAFNRLRIPLKIAGDGPLRKSLEGRAGPLIEFLGWVDQRDLVNLYIDCRALVFPGEEDLGLAPLEAQACGRPVIAYGRGGATETVNPSNGLQGMSGCDDEPTGVFFYEPTPSSLIEAIERFEQQRQSFQPEAARRQASRFSKTRFKEEISDYIDVRLREWRR